MNPSERIQINEIKRVSGFTLLELLVVVFIIGLVSGYAVLSIGWRDMDRPLEEEATKLKQLFTLAADEALVLGRPIGFFIQAHSYRFMIARRQSWSPLQESSVFREQTLPQGWRLEYTSAETPVSPQSNSHQPQPEAGQPTMVFLPSGELAPFELMLFSEEKEGGYQLALKPSGEFTLTSLSEGRK